MQRFKIQTRIRNLMLASLLLLLGTTQVFAAPSFDTNRARLLGHMIEQELSRHHYSDKALDDNLSKAAYDLYLKQLDGQKRFLLKDDIKELSAYKLLIDDALRTGRLDLPELGERLLDRRITQVKAICPEILAKGFDFERVDKIETDPEKIDYVENAEQLHERWRQILKYQTINRYLGLLEDELKTTDPQALAKASVEVQKRLRGEARKKVLKSQLSSLDRMLEETTEDHYDRYLNSIARAYDPHTDYLAPTSKEDFDISMSGSLEGIGATLREDDGYIKVVKIIPGSAAYRQGHLEADDIILKVAEGAKGEPVDITDTRIRDAVTLIRGKKGTEVRLTVKKPDGRQLVVPIVRDIVEIEETFVKGELLVDEASKTRFGYLKVPSFYRDYTGKTGRNCTDDMRAEVQKLVAQNIDGLIIDLRNNGGGSLGDAVDTTGLFIDQGPVVQVRSRGGNIRELSDENSGVEYAGPILVLVNRFSASASEIFAGALQDYKRALIVGDEHTHGKGTVQAMLDLDRAVRLQGMEKYLPLGALKVTIQKFYRISGESTQERGVIPDVILPSRFDGLKSGEKYLPNALPWDHIKSAEYQTWPKPIGNIEELKAESARRVAASKKFKEIVEIAARSNERRADSRQSLKLEQIIKERQELLDLQGTTSDSPHGGLKPKKNESKDEPSLKEKLKDDPYVAEAEKLLLTVLHPEKN
ncbi:carboxy terminal-processing peptidase [Geopsychrobacter electrodiphilus]|uniref:carboxy terminal-processing peptidase n=1 Tax=Geopsychrobacter electrodiphilus TaxID=225196 RepID=UPI00037CA3E9|nr:carboxy terminal-processing peptidase [Geopsychrobacter electrodiphilus]